VLDAPVAREIGHRGLAEGGRVEIAVGDDGPVVLRCRLRDDLAIGADDAGPADQRRTALNAAVRISNYGSALPIELKTFVPDA
jgi:hypothetical protein